MVSIALQSQSRDVHAVLRRKRVASHFTRTKLKITATTTLYVTADRDARRSDGSKKYKGVRQQSIIKY